MRFPKEIIGNWNRLCLPNYYLQVEKGLSSSGYGTVYQGWYGNLKVAIKDYVQIEL